MNKALLLTLLLVASTFAQGLQSEVEVSTGDNSTLPASATSSSSGGSGGSGGRPSALSISNVPAPAQPSSWSYLQQSTIGNSKWIYPSGSFQILPRYKVVTFTIKFRTDCPQADVIFAFATTGLGFVILNGNLIQSWAESYPKVHTLNLKKPNLLCGCNQIKVLVYNYYYASPAALTYSLSQDTSSCYNCKDVGVTFYNRETCQCQCAFQCPDRWVQADYPSCGCKCQTDPATVRCSANRQFNRRTCQCDCLPKCCSSGSVWNSTTCSCQKELIICTAIACPSGYRKDENCKCVPIICTAIACPSGYKKDENCKCVPIICTAIACQQGYKKDENCRCVPICGSKTCVAPQTISNYDTCECTCPYLARCAQGYNWNATSCSCVPACSSQVCRTPQTLDPNTCQCRCPYLAYCTQGYSWNSTTCSCECTQGPLILCARPFVFNQTQCKCACPSVQTCSYPKRWNPETCSCQCTNFCIATMTLNPITCACEPIRFTSLSGNSGSGGTTNLESTVEVSGGN